VSDLAADKPGEVLLAVALPTQLLLNKVLIRLHTEGSGVPVPEHIGDPVRYRVIVDLEVQFFDFFRQENPFQRLAVPVEHLPAGFVLFRPAPEIDQKTQARLAFHQDEFLLANGPPVNGPIIGCPPTEEAASAPAPAGGWVEEIDEGNDREAGNHDHEPLLMAPNVSKHKSAKQKIQGRNLHARPWHGQTQNWHRRNESKQEIDGVPPRL
jgi:hypothetical protein